MPRPCRSRLSLAWHGMVPRWPRRSWRRAGALRLQHGWSIQHHRRLAVDVNALAARLAEDIRPPGMGCTRGAPVLMRGRVVRPAACESGACDRRPAPRADRTQTCWRNARTASRSALATRTTHLQGFTLPAWVGSTATLHSATLPRSAHRRTRSGYNATSVAMRGEGRTCGRLARAVRAPHARSSTAACGCSRRTWLDAIRARMASSQADRERGRQHSRARPSRRPRLDGPAHRATIDSG
jgi:hypothetical protein